MAHGTNPMDVRRFRMKGSLHREFQWGHKEVCRGVAGPTWGRGEQVLRVRVTSVLVAARRGDSSGGPTDQPGCCLLVGSEEGREGEKNKNIRVRERREGLLTRSSGLGGDVLVRRGLLPYEGINKLNTTTEPNHVRLDTWRTGSIPGRWATAGRCRLSSHQDQRRPT